MLFAFIMCVLVWLVSAIYLAFLSLASKSEIQAKFPEYASKIYRPSTEVVTRQGGPVRALALVCLKSPEKSSASIGLMQVLAGIVLASGLSAV